MSLNDFLVSYKRVDLPEDDTTTLMLDAPDVFDYSYLAPKSTETSEEKSTISKADVPQHNFDDPSLLDNTKKTNFVSTPSTLPKTPVKSSKKWSNPYSNTTDWAQDLIGAYRKAGITNENALKMLIAQDALESGWGKSAQGSYNFGNLTTGANWGGDYVVGNDKDAKGNAIKQKFRSYKSIDDYAADKVQFLKKLYSFDENDDINTFTAKLMGQNKAKRRYAEAADYDKVLKNIYNSFNDDVGENKVPIQEEEKPEIGMDAASIAKRQAEKEDLIKNFYWYTHPIIGPFYSMYRASQSDKDSARKRLANTPAMVGPGAIIAWQQTQKEKVRPQYKNMSLIKMKNHSYVVDTNKKDRDSFELFMNSQKPFIRNQK